MNYANSGFAGPSGEILVTLDGETVVLPGGRNSLNAIRSYLETLALAGQRVLAVFAVDGCPVNLALPLVDNGAFCRVDAETIPLEELPLLLLTTAGQQVDRARESVEAALTLVLINNHSTARELWWKIACQLKEPVLTLSLMPEDLCQLCCGTSFHKLRRWQLEQIAVIVRNVDAAGDSQDNIQLSDALEKLVLPWLQKLDEHIRLWHDATQAGARLGIKNSSL
jgi:hypothetical protein